MVRILLLLSAVRLLPHILVVTLAPWRRDISQDLDRWAVALLGKGLSSRANRMAFFVRTMTFHPEFRALFYHRIKGHSVSLAKLLACFCRPMPTLFIDTKDIGSGLFIQHGFSTIISARRIGRNCWVNQQVTIGHTTADDAPVLGDNVTVYAGAKVLGRITVGDNVIVGANAVVVKDVPENCTVVGVPAHIVRRNGERVNEPLA